MSIRGLNCFVAVLLSLLAFTTARATTLQDFFTNRETVLTASGQVTGNNSNATVEVGEPQIGGKPGGHSVWLSWVAPSDGVATFRTDGSTFDTLLSAFYFGSTNDTTLDKLHLAAANDDAPGLGTASLIQFGALAGQHYEIAVDGYYGSVGSILLQWSFIAATSPPPVIISVPTDRAAAQGTPVTLSVNMQTSPSLQLRWRLDENDLDVNTTNLVIPSFQATNVGHYTLRITIGSVRFFTTPTELQINSENATNALARDKLLDSPGSELLGEDGGNPFSPSGPSGPIKPLGPGTIGVVRGFTGSQVFDTTYATADPGEPPHCGHPAISTYWLAYQPPTNGTITLDTIGSTYHTIMEAYAYNGPLTNYQNLISLACDIDSLSPGGASRIQFPVFKTRQYLIVVDGTNGATGTAWLNYNLNTNLLPVAPALLQQPAAMTVASGTTVLFSPSFKASPPLQCFWKKDGVTLPGATSSSLLLTNVTTSQSGNYTLNVTNDMGSLVITQSLRVVIPTRCSVTPLVARMRISWPTVSGQRYTIEQATSLPGPWQALTNSFLGDGQTATFDLLPADTTFYRLRVQ